MTHISRRHFLNLTAASFAGSTGLLGAMTQQKAFGANTSGYKALVCLSLKGGMDHADTFIPYDLASHDALKSVREGLFSAYGVGSGTSSRDLDNLFKLTPADNTNLGGREFALPPQLAALKTMFDQGDLAIVGNVGPLIEPTTRTTMETGSAILPKRLFSHNDQHSTWSALNVEGERFGWGGRFADAVIKADPTINPQFVSLTTGSTEVFLSGQMARPFYVPGNGPAPIYAYNRRYYLGYTDEDDATRERLATWFNNVENGDDNVYQRDFARMNKQALETTEEYRNAVDVSTPLVTTFPDTRTGRQLKAVAEAIRLQSTLNVSRQVFVATMGGFDSHSSQASNLPSKHTELADALSAFRAALIELGQWNNVTLFSSSEFGRTTIDNGDGTDHGWGGHHLVMGGAVQGQHFYGQMAGSDVSADYYTPSRGRLIPAVSVEQYAATLGGWFGLDQSELAAALPNLANFDQKNLGFMG